jgi:dihydroorotate dehydrogenase subfamily 2
LEQKIFGIRFRNPIGLAAGFDKDARMISIMEDVGFGFVEVGSLTKLRCEGNTGQRMKRLISKKSLWIYLGLNNRGADETFEEIKYKRFKIPYGISAAKTNCMETVDSNVAIEDYIYTLKKFREIAAYFTVNISCPNAFGGQPFSDPLLFARLMHRIDGLRLKQPIFVKLSPDLSRQNLDKILEISKKYRVKGFICTNLTKKNTGFESGGCSGKMLEKFSDEIIKYVYLKTKNWKYRTIIIGVGGVFSAEDAYRKMRLGASLIQLITGMIYEGPGLIGDINRGLVKFMNRDGFKRIDEIVGVDVK